MTGNTLGRYEITSHLGSGGMGDVYQATDLKLGRSVALKMLPDEFARDAARVSRFEREARMLASLNHPAIAALYGIEEADGRPFLVMELVPGPTLAERIATGPLSVRDSLTIALNIATALEAAHERGIIHRDLKPANIKVTADGAVKLLDFGLAKATTAAAVEAAPATTVTGGTELGTVMGTPAYMSPEQAMGQATDQRTDIWAFGAVLYEMLTGRCAFRGTDTTETLAEVIKSDPDWSALPPLPSLVLPFLKRCLSKNPKDRVHHIADMRLALAGGYDAPATASGSETRPGAKWRWLGWSAAAAIAASVAVAGAAFFGGDEEASAPISVRQLTFRQGEIVNARFASDGQVVVYGAAWDGEPYRLYTTLANGFQSRPIDLPAADLLAISKENVLAIAPSRPPVDGFLPHGRLAQVPLAGGAPRAVADGIAGAAYAPDGELAAIVRRVGNGAELEFPVGTVVHREPQIIIHPSVSPDGRYACFISSWQRLMLVERGGAVEVLADGLQRANRCAWNESGTEIWIAQSPGSATHTNLEVVDVRTRQRRVAAAFTGLVLLQDLRPGGAALIAAGTLRFSVHGAASATARERDLSVFDATRVGHLSPSGKELLLVENSTGAQDGGLFLRAMDGTAPIQFGDATPVAITADGSIVAVLGDGTRSAAVSDMVTLVPTGTGSARTIHLPIQIQHLPGNTWGTNVPEHRTADFSDDGRRLLIPFARAGERPPRAYVHDLEAGWTRAVTPEDRPGSVALSPNGRFVASNQPEGLYVYDVESGEQRLVPGGPDPGVLARWSTTENTVYMIEQSGASARLVARDLLTGDRRTVRDYRATDPAGVSRFDLWVSRDGNAYAYTLDRRLTNLFVVEGLR